MEEEEIIMTSDEMVTWIRGDVKNFIWFAVNNNPDSMNNALINEKYIREELDINGLFNLLSKLSDQHVPETLQPVFNQFSYDVNADNWTSSAISQEAVLKLWFMYKGVKQAS